MQFIIKQPFGLFSPRLVDIEAKAQNDDLIAKDPVKVTLVKSVEDSWAKAEWYRRADEATTSGLSDSLLSGRSSNSSKAVVVVGAVAASSIHYSLSDDEDGKQLLLHDDVGEEDHPPSELLLVLKLCYCSMYTTSIAMYNVLLMSEHDL